MKYDRVILIVLDSAGAGFLPDAADYGDLGANTLGHIADAASLIMPNCGALGLGNILTLRGTPPAAHPAGRYGRAAEKSKGKDTTTGHWEIAGLVLREPFPVYPEGFPPYIIKEFSRKIKSEVLGNCVASGTEIIARLGDEHVHTKKPIVYTSADSVFQIAAHESVIPLQELYKMCEIARSFLPVGRVIARPFTGISGSYVRTARRHDYSMEPAGETMLDRLVAAGHQVHGVGKIGDIFAMKGISTTLRCEDNDEGVEKLCAILDEGRRGLIFVNLVDFDMKFGHRRDVIGYKNALESFDARLPRIMRSAGKSSLLIITADHGCDPIFKGTDHTREYIPILAWTEGITPGDIGTRESFTDIAATVEQALTGRELPGAFI